MFRFIGLSLLSLSTLVMSSCGKDDDPVSYDYHAHIVQPSSADKNMGEILFINIEFESHSGEAVEHINVRIFNAANTLEVYNMPTDPHVPGGPNSYNFSDQFALSAYNGVTAGDWVLEAKVWGHDEGQDEILERVEFHVHP